VAVADFTAYKAAILAPNQRIRIQKQPIAAVSGRYDSLWTATPNAGAAPGGNAACTSATTGALGQQDGSTSLWLGYMQSGRERAGALIVVDRLVHQDGLSGTVATAQTTNLPTAALTRYTSGVGVLAALEIYTGIGVTATTFTASYTNSAGVAGRTSPAYTVGGGNFNTTGRFIIMPMQAGDVGVKSVESVTLALSTGTAGNFGVTLFKPLGFFGYPFPFGENPVYQDGLLSGGGMIPQVQNGACLALLDVANATATALINNEMGLFEA
jgi:hypothetical protein